MVKSSSLSKLSRSAGMLIGVVVGIVGHLLTHLMIYSGGGWNPFRFLFHPLTVTLIAIVIVWAVAVFVVHRRRLLNAPLPVTVRDIRWFSSGVFWMAALGVLIVSIIGVFPMAASAGMYLELVLFTVGLFPLIVALILLPLGMLAAKILARLLSS